MSGRILIACEYSGVVTEAFRNLGQDAWSCDLLPTTGTLPQYHLQQDIIPLLKEDWSMIIAFPPCTHLCSPGARWFEEKRKDGRQQEGIDFFMKFIKCKCPKIAIENPVGIMSKIYRKPDQIVHPYMFGDPYQKSTCLWLKNLPKLVPTNNVKDYMLTPPAKERCKIHYASPSKERWKDRSVTPKGLASAMAEQWGNL